MNVELVFSPAPRETRVWRLDVPAGSCVADALRAAGWQRPGGPDWGAQPSTGIWGRRQALDVLLREGDRVEVYRPLRVDPKVARRERFVRQGARSTGLFAQRRPGAKQGY
ncbi:RnfH family protein [Hydrogenophaga sp. OTU3427]|uniref:RnfH family protein n=1 Tax=Hydrogenophaga sp. OTU3427 TaxID=3043856 RepID=UPI00313B4E3A